ncbi:MAG: addiction module antidote protein, HigA family [Proteobacteria bacterium]|nr:MAG: addiction module antidote protein, HigA family [Pseudomonadota bacterium]PIE39900.1 MAG: addiction module antidote protein, HigA family [Gammaproteobacteria bacterium]
MIPSNRTATHPGVILLKEFLEPLELTQKALATHIHVPVQRVNEIVRGKRGITPETAWLLSEAFCTTPEFWLNLQSVHDLSANRPDRHVQPLVAVGM